MAPGWDRDQLLTASEASAKLGDVTPQLFAMWVRHDKLRSVGKRGRSPLYRWGDVVDVERATRLHPNSARNPTRGRREMAEAAA